MSHYPLTCGQVRRLKKTKIWRWQRQSLAMFKLRTVGLGKGRRLSKPPILLTGEIVRPSARIARA
jgi:hypothetical protein